MTMTDDERLMSFEEFRTNREDVMQQQNEFFRDRETAEEVLRSGEVNGTVWTPWYRDVNVTA